MREEEKVRKRRAKVSAIDISLPRALRVENVLHKKQHQRLVRNGT